MTCGKLAPFEHGPNRRGQTQQADQIGDVAAALAEGARQLLLRMAELVDQPTVAFRFLERCEILALHVFEQRDLQGLAVRQSVHTTGSSWQPAS